MARPHETPLKKLRKRKLPNMSFGLVEALASKPSEELEPKPKVSDEVQDSRVPSQGDRASNSAEGESSQAPSAAPLVVAPHDANVLMSSILKKMMDLIGILTAQLSLMRPGPWVQPGPRLSRPSHNLSGNGRAATSRDTCITNRDLDVSRRATRG